MKLNLRHIASSHCVFKFQCTSIGLKMKNNRMVRYFADYIYFYFWNANV